MNDPNQKTAEEIIRGTERIVPDAKALAPGPCSASCDDSRNSDLAGAIGGFIEDLKRDRDEWKASAAQYHQTNTELVRQLDEARRWAEAYRRLFQQACPRQHIDIFPWQNSFIERLAP